MLLIFRLLLTSSLAVGMFATNAIGQTTMTQSAAVVLQPLVNYKLIFRVVEFSNGKVTAEREYITVLASGTKGGSIRVGEQVPYLKANGNSSNTWEYANVGVKIDFNRIKPEDQQVAANQLALTISSDVTSLIDSSTSTHKPIIDQDMWSTNVALTMDQTQLLFSGESPASNHGKRITVTATRLKDQ